MLYSPLLVWVKVWLMMKPAHKYLYNMRWGVTHGQWPICTRPQSATWSAEGGEVTIRAKASLARAVKAGLLEGHFGVPRPTYVPWEFPFQFCAEWEDIWSFWTWFAQLLTWHRSERIECSSTDLTKHTFYRGSFPKILPICGNVIACKNHLWILAGTRISVLSLADPQIILLILDFLHTAIVEHTQLCLPCCRGSLQWERCWPHVLYHISGFSKGVVRKMGETWSALVVKWMKLMLLLLANQEQTIPFRWADPSINANTRHPRDNRDPRSWASQLSIFRDSTARDDGIAFFRGMRKLDQRWLMTDHRLSRGDWRSTEGEIR